MLGVNTDKLLHAENDKWQTDLSSERAPHWDKTATLTALG
jgi:hypothetical protein